MHAELQVYRYHCPEQGYCPFLSWGQNDCSEGSEQMHKYLHCWQQTLCWHLHYLKTKHHHTSVLVYIFFSFGVLRLISYIWCYNNSPKISKQNKPLFFKKVCMMRIGLKIKISRCLWGDYKCLEEPVLQTNVIYWVNCFPFLFAIIVHVDTLNLSFVFLIG